MEKVELSVPDMYADHHVLRARSALAALAGVQDVVASSAFHTVAVHYDPTRTDVAAIRAALAEAGYPVEEDARVKVPVFPVASRRGDPAWDRLGVRISRTDPRDAKANR